MAELPAPTAPGCGSASDPVFLHWHQVPIGLTNQYTKINTNKTITLVNIAILVWDYNRDSQICLQYQVPTK